jgi:hypothetical protein
MVPFCLGLDRTEAQEDIDVVEVPLEDESQGIKKSIAC